MRKRWRNLLLMVLLIFLMIWLYTGSLIGVQHQVKADLQALEQALVKAGHSPSYFVISGRRWAWDNYLLTQWGGAAKNSRHLKGEAIDIIVLDVNRDGQYDEADVGIVYQILDKEIIQDRGGLGTYLRETGFLNRQMIHFDCRGTRARWNR